MLHHTHRQASRLLLIAAKEGATDQQIVDALQQGLPHLTDPDPPFLAALQVVPVEDLCRTWPASRTCMLRRTSKKVKKIVDKMRLPAVVRLSWSFWFDPDNGSKEEKHQFFHEKIAFMTTWSSINRLDLCSCQISGSNAECEWLGKLLTLCPALTSLDLSGEGDYVHDEAVCILRNDIGPEGAEILANVLL